MSYADDVSLEELEEQAVEGQQEEAELVNHLAQEIFQSGDTSKMHTHSLLETQHLLSLEPRVARAVGRLKRNQRHQKKKLPPFRS